MGKVDELLEKISKIEKKKEYENLNLTKKEKQFEYRKNIIMEVYKMLTGKEMSLSEFLLYDEKFNDVETPRGWGLKNWIETKGLNT